MGVEECAEHGNRMSQLARPWWWALDYLYAGWRQVVSVLRRRPPGNYEAGESSRPAVVLLPGVYETWLFLEPAAQRLVDGGYRVYTVPGLGFNKRPVPESARLVRQRLEELSRIHGVRECVLLAHSKGGLIGKHAMLDGLLPVNNGSTEPLVPRILGMVAVGTPFAGSAYAKFLFSRTLRQFSPRDAVLLSLQAQQEANDRIISIFAQFDPHIPGGSALAGAKNLRLPLSGHFRTLRQPLVLAAVEESVAALETGNGRS
ncbi:hypothetical protein GCM10025778_06480 [Paeniglutamicibacter antarcticus]|uniref:Alpha/beta hydrolase n=2 Tax=Paeniglutamicibacter antarcticus TaxID=494023 RepID=A0ABP9TK78_9MICC